MLDEYRYVSPKLGNATNINIQQIKWCNKNCVQMIMLKSLPKCGSFEKSASTSVRQFSVFCSNFWGKMFEMWSNSTMNICVIIIDFWTVIMLFFHKSKSLERRILSTLFILIIYENPVIEWVLSHSFHAWCSWSHDHTNNWKHAKRAKIMKKSEAV